MVAFKGWRDAYLFMKEYGNFTCLNCDYGGHSNLDTESEHSDGYYARLFCSNWMSMVRLDYQFICEKWKKGDDTLDGKMECDTWNIPSKVADIIDSSDKKWTFEEIKELVDGAE